jgi:hypothetical protein
MATQAPPAPVLEKGIKIVSHSHLFYWWPVWLIGYIMALLTYIDSSYLVVVPAHQGEFRVTVGEREAEVVHQPKTDEKKQEDMKEPLLHMSRHTSYGVVFTFVVLLVIVITNVPLRGMWSFVVIMFLIMLSIIISFAHGWDVIFRTFGGLRIGITLGGYVLISTALLAVWLITFFFFDRQMYMIFEPGQLRVCMEIGGGEKNYDSAGMTIEKQRSDLFRHWILGLGSGDLIVNTTGAQVHHFDLPNVLFIGRKVHQIEEMLRQKAVVRGATS